MRGQDRQSAKAAEVAMTLLLKSRDMPPPAGGRRRYVVETGSAYSAASSIFEEKIRHAQQAYAVLTLTAWSVTTGCAYRSAMAQSYGAGQLRQHGNTMRLQGAQARRREGHNREHLPSAWAMSIESA